MRDGRSRFAGCAALYITDDPQAKDPPLNITRAFRSFHPAAFFDVLHNGEPLRRVKVFACFHYAGLPE